jgi:hypothetical protein
MQYEHPIDRLVYRLRVPILILAALSAPIMLISYGKMFVLAASTWPTWVIVPVFIAHLMGWIGIACLFDSLSERRK